MGGQNDRTYAFTLNPPPNSWFLKQAAGIEKGSGKPGKETVGSVSLRAIYEIALIKKQVPSASGVAVGPCFPPSAVSLRGIPGCQLPQHAVGRRLPQHRGLGTKHGPEGGAISLLVCRVGFLL